MKWEISCFSLQVRIKSHQACKKWNVFLCLPLPPHAFAILQLLFLPSGFSLQDISPPCILKPTCVGPALGCQIALVSLRLSSSPWRNTSEAFWKLLACLSSFQILRWVKSGLHHFDSLFSILPKILAHNTLYIFGEWMIKWLNASVKIHERSESTKNIYKKTQMNWPKWYFNCLWRMHHGLHMGS